MIYWDFAINSKSMFGFNLIQIKFFEEKLKKPDKFGNFFSYYTIISCHGYGIQNRLIPISYK